MNIIKIVIANMECWECHMICVGLLCTPIGEVADDSQPLVN